MSGWDVLIVGGGPGGSTAAWQLARAGVRVLLLEAKKFPRVKLCAGWVTKSCMADLELDPAAYPKTIQPFSAIYVGFGGKLKETRWEETASYGIVRKEFDDFLLRRAEGAGAVVREGVRVRAVEAGPDGVRLDMGGEAVEGRVVIGAGGYTCPVARALGEVSPEEVIVLTQESESEVGAGILEKIAPHYGRPELFAEPDFKGYSWYFTKGGFLNIGVGCVGKSPSVHERRESLLENLRSSGRLRADIELTPFKGHAYAIQRGRARIAAGERFLLIGDAAGLAKDFSGEGIGPAVRSARMAATAILGWLEGKAELGEYAQNLAAEYGSPEEGLMDRLVDRLPDQLIRKAAKLICGNAWLRRRLILEGAFGVG
ncbi:MAG: NAD(P)/FAD-dependent oxidoreductase [bacterium]